MIGVTPAKRANGYRETIAFMLAAEAIIAYAVASFLLDAAGREAGSLAVAAAALSAIVFLATKCLLFIRLSRRAVAGAIVVVGIGAALIVVQVGWHGGAWSGMQWTEGFAAELGQITKAFPFELSLAAIMVAAAGRGGILALGRDGARHCGSSFQFGAVALAAMHGLAALKGTAPGSAVPLTVAFFGCSLAAIACYRQDSPERGRGAGSPAPGLILVAAIALPLLAGTLAGLALDANAIRLLLLPVKLAGDAIGALLTLIASLLPPPSVGEAMPDLAMAAAPAAGAKENFALFQLSDEVRDVGRLLWSVLFLGLVALAAGRLLGDAALGMLRRGSTANGTVEAVSGGWLNGLRALPLAILRLYEDCQWRLYRWRQSRPRESSPAARTVRETYRGLLYWAAKRGLPRLAAETPDEYLQRLAGAFPAAAGELRVLTESYVRARYASQELLNEDLLLTARAWRALHMRLRGRSRLDGKRKTCPVAEARVARRGGLD